MHTFEVTLDDGSTKTVEADYFTWGDECLSFYVDDDDNEVAIFRVGPIESVQKVKESVTLDFGIDSLKASKELKDFVASVMTNLKRTGRI